MTMETLSMAAGIAVALSLFVNLGFGVYFCIKKRWLQAAIGLLSPAAVLLWVFCYYFDRLANLLK